MASWTRRIFDSAGVTEYPAGPALERLGSRFGGSVILALDVSGSMARHDAGPKKSAARLEEAKRGCAGFIAEAVAAGYRVGVVLWASGVEGVSRLSRTEDEGRCMVAGARPNGGTSVVPALGEAQRLLLAEPSGDMVVAIFGDGDLGPKAAAQAKAKELEGNHIRIITCGLGEASARELGSIATDPAGGPGWGGSGSGGSGSGGPGGSGSGGKTGSRPGGSDGLATASAASAASAETIAESIIAMGKSLRRRPSS
ncbi:MAG: VWA domain-containing protein [Bifidobacteriaceae bacterium]|jgi:hypothetical protein|nr:VWA domain-containing protein [Bifidobacteriaceae bacterium]